MWRIIDNTIIMTSLVRVKYNPSKPYSITSKSSSVKFGLTFLMLFMDEFINFFFNPTHRNQF